MSIGLVGHVVGTKMQKTAKVEVFLSIPWSLHAKGKPFSEK